MTRTIERRAFNADLEMRSTASGFHLRGYAARFDSPSNGEVVRASAFNKTLAERADVRLLINHDGVPLARTKSGTLTLSVDSIGLPVDAPDLDPANPDVQRLASAMDRRDLDQMSFAFIDHTPVEQRDDPGDFAGLRNVRDCQLFDVSVVTFPWYEDTQAEMNSLDGAFEVLKRGGMLNTEQRDLIVALVGAPEEEEIEEAPEPTETHVAPWKLEAAKFYARGFAA